jgi:hypothetical protein
MMEDPFQGFLESVGGIQDVSNVFQEYIIVLYPLLKGKVLDVHVMTPSRGPFHISHHAGGDVVFLEACIVQLGEP